MTKQAAKQIIGTCPVCKDKLMAFEPVDDTHVECGGCGTLVKVAEVVPAT